MVLSDWCVDNENPVSGSFGAAARRYNGGARSVPVRFDVQPVPWCPQLRVIRDA